MGTGPRIALVGAGGFGVQHLNEWLRLASEKRVVIVGVAVAGEESRRRVERDYAVPAFRGLPEELLRRADAIDIVTPSATHFELVRRCLPHAHVLVEKPLAMTAGEAEELRNGAQAVGRVLMVNHVFRFDPVLLKLREVLQSMPSRIESIEGTFLQPEPGDRGLSINHELLHLFDALDLLLGKEPHTAISEGQGRVNRISLRYPGEVNAVLTLGWRGPEKIRSLEFDFQDRKVIANFIDRMVTVMQRDSMNKIFVDDHEGPLRKSLCTFLDAISGRPVPYPDAGTGRRIVAIAEQALPGPRQARPSVGIVGAGIFGVACALELAPHAEVTLFERHSELMSEASYSNQWRFHSGFHYPRSAQTVQEIQATRGDFYSVFGDAVIDVTSYYCTSRHAAEITADRYLAVCTANNLSFEIEETPPPFVNADRISLCLKTDESVFDFHRLRATSNRMLQGSRSIELLVNTQVTDGRIDGGGRKVLQARQADRSFERGFDYLINTTYANNNLVAKWFGFPVRRLRFDLCEMLVLEIPMPSISVTILDGPFCSLVSTGRDNRFILTHVHDSVLKSRITPDGLPPVWGEPASNAATLRRNCTRYFPVLKNAQFVESRFGVRTVEAFTEDYDGRPTVVTDHGFGCWSVLGGKIGSCVSNAREILRHIVPDAPVNRSERPDAAAANAR